MTALPNETELLLAAHHFAVDAKEGTGRLGQAVKLQVHGALYEQLRIACERALSAPPANLAMVRAGIGELIVALGEDADARRKAGAPTSTPPQRPPLPNVRLPYKDDDLFAEKDDRP